VSISLVAMQEEEKKEKIYHDLETRLTVLENKINNPVSRIENELLSLHFYTTKFQRVPGHYYDLSLEQRANLLKTTSLHLCKSIILQNTACSHERIDDISESKYYCVIIQYAHKLNGYFSLSSLLAQSNNPY
jgi:hypothetical protein